jgi:argininosuccinate lyase
MQQAMPSSVALWAGGFAAELRDDAEGLRDRRARLAQPAGFGAGYGTPGLPGPRATRAGWFPEVHAPVTAVQLSRGKAKRNCCSSARCWSRTSDAWPRTCCCSTRRNSRSLRCRILHHRLVDHAAEAQPRRLRAGAAAARQWPGLPAEVLGIFAKLPRVTSATCNSSSRRCSAHRPRARHRRHHVVRDRRRAFPRAGIKLDPSIHAAEEANALVAREGIPFREAYRRIGEKYRK